MAGLDIPSKLRRAIGQGKVLPYEQILAKLQPFDRDKDGALTKEELAEAFVAFGCGGPWFCNIMARAIWQACESVIPPPVLWIKTTLVAASVHGFMQLQPRAPKRLRITPESAYGWEPLTYLDGTPVDPNQKSIPMLPDEKWDGVPAALSKEANEARKSPPPPPAAQPGQPLVQPPSRAKETPAVKSAQSGPPQSPAPQSPPRAAPQRPQAAPAQGRPATAVPGRPAPSPGPAAAPARPIPARPVRPGPRR